MELDGSQEKIALAESFVHEVVERCPIIDAVDAQMFAMTVLDHNPPEGFLDRLARAHQFWDKETFQRDLDTLAQHIRDDMADDEYSIVVSLNGKSEAWLIQQLLLPPYAIPRPTNIFSAHSGGRDRLRDSTEVQNVLPAGSTIVYIDDVSISGATAIDAIFPGDRFSAYDCHAFVLRTTNVARELIEEKGVHLVSPGAPILTLAETMTADDIAFMERLQKEITLRGLDAEPFVDNDSAFVTWYKLPDNYPMLLTGGIYDNFPPLLQKDILIPPYQPPEE